MYLNKCLLSIIYPTEDIFYFKFFNMLVDLSKNRTQKDM